MCLFNEATIPVLAECLAYGEVREKFVDQVSEISEKLLVDMLPPEVLTHLILDLSVYTNSEQDIYKLELHSRDKGEG